MEGEPAEGREGRNQRRKCSSDGRRLGWRESRPKAGEEPATQMLEWRGTSWMEGKGV